jgi:hypothetical protein
MHSEQELYYILVLWWPIIISVCVDLGSLVYSGGYSMYSIILYGDSSKCIYIKKFSAIICHYHIDKRVTGNKHYVLHIIVMTANYYPSLRRFENFVVFWGVF